MEFKSWLIKEESADRDKQLDKSTLVTVKPVTKVGELSSYGYLKKQLKR